MKRAFACGFITIYLGCLGWGIGTYTLKTGYNSHPAMYFVVWDMFCGWSAYSQRVQLIAEGESGQYYHLNPPPWGEHRPYGKLGREQYDTRAIGLHKTALNVLNRTEHEPISRVLVVEEVWPKRYNLPQSLWDLRNPGEEKDRRVYRTVRLGFTTGGELLFQQPGFVSVLGTRAVANNPRLQRDAQRSRPIFALKTYRGGSAIPFQARELSQSAH